MNTKKISNNILARNFFMNNIPEISLYLTRPVWLEKKYELFGIYKCYEEKQYHKEINSYMFIGYNTKGIPIFFVCKKINHKIRIFSILNKKEDSLYLEKYRKFVLKDYGYNYNENEFEFTSFLFDNDNDSRLWNG